MRALKKIEVEYEAGSPVLIEPHPNEEPPSRTIHWLKRSQEGPYKTKDGKLWDIALSHYRPTEKE